MGGQPPGGRWVGGPVSRSARARAGVVVGATVLVVAACEKKKTTPASNPYQVGSVLINLPPSVQV